MSSRAVTFVGAIAMFAAFAPGVSSQRLVEIARTTARGGNCERIVVSGDGRHFVTVGELGDLLWWDLGERRLLRRVESKAKYVTAIALHPSEPWAVVATTATGEWNGVAWRCDFDTGTVRELWSVYTNDLGFDAKGEFLRAELRTGRGQSRDVAYRSEALRGDGPLEEVPGVLPIARGGQSRTREATSPDNRLAVQCEDDKVFHTGGARREVRIDNLDTNDGTIVAADLQGQLHVCGVAGERTVLAGHAGDAHQLVFSPDGRFVAVVGLGATRVVDLAGNDVEEWSGTRIVLPGPEGADFWIFDRRELRRWSASTRRDVVPPLRWNEPSLCVARRSGQRGAGWVIDEGRRHHVFTLGTACVVDGVPWLGTDQFFHMRPWRLVTSGFQCVGEEGGGDPRGAQPIALLACKQDRVVSVSSRPADCGGVMPHSYARVLDRSGNVLARWDAVSSLQWAAAGPGDAELVLSSYGGVLESLSAESLQPLARREFPRDPVAAVTFGKSRFLTAIGAELLVLDARSLETVATMTGPAGLVRIDVVAASPTRRHVAVARGSDVRILRVE